MAGKAGGERNVSATPCATGLALLQVPVGGETRVDLVAFKIVWGEPEGFKHLPTLHCYSWKVWSADHRNIVSERGSQNASAVIQCSGTSSGGILSQTWQQSWLLDNL